MLRQKRWVTSDRGERYDSQEVGENPLTKNSWADKGLPSVGGPDRHRQPVPVMRLDVGAKLLKCLSNILDILAGYMAVDYAPQAAER